MLELYHDWRSFCSVKVRLCLAEKALPWESRFIDLTKFDHTRPEYLKLNPNGVVPTLVHDGTPIHESTVINEYLEEIFPDPSLTPKTAIERARMRFWVKFEDDVLHPVIRPATFALMMSRELAKRTDAELDEMVRIHPNKKRAEEFRIAARSPVDQAAVEQAKGNMMRALERMEACLAQTRWLGCDRYTLADIAAAPFIDRLEELNCAGLWSGMPRVEDWIRRMKERPAYQEAIPQAHQRFATAFGAG